MKEEDKDYLHEIVKRIDENVKEIKLQTIKTNGRVNCLEEWRNKVTGALIIMNLMLLPIIITKLIQILL